MLSKKKFDANRANAKHSTGPKTKNGKLKSSKNAIKHGIYATKTFLWGEDKKLYAAIRLEQNTRFQPKSYVERALVDQLVAELWRLKRISRAEFLLASEIQSELRKEPREFTPEEEDLMALYKSDPEKFIQKYNAYQAMVAQGNREEGEEGVATAKRVILWDHLHGGLNDIDKTYMKMFVDGQQDQMQRLLVMKRQGLQVILSIERELEHRKSLRADDAA